MRTFGTAKLQDGQWHIEAQPHVAMRIKRMFKQARQERGAVVIKCTDETSRDLQWFCERYPLDFPADAQQTLEERSRAFDRRAELSAQILAGKYSMPKALAMHCPPRVYQEQAAAIAANNRALLLTDELGLGKSCSALTLLATTRALPAVIVCPVHLQLQWQRECWKFLRLVAYIAKTGAPKFPRGRIPDVLIVSYSKIARWSDIIAGTFRTVIFDESQELRRPESLKYDGARQVAYAAEYRMGLSATPIYNYGEEFHSVFEVLAPDALGSREEFIREWCSSYTDKSGKHAIQDPKAFGSYLRESGLMLRRTRAEVGRELPKVSRIVQTVASDPSALESISDCAAELARTILAQQGSVQNFDRMQAAGEFDMRLRQATGIGKAPYVAEFVRMLLETDEEPVVLFGWHRAVYSIWLDALAEFKPTLYTGSESPKQKAQSIDRFIRGESRVIIISLRSGAGIDGLQDVCSRLVVGELDWSPGAIDQCVGRLDRDRQTKNVMAYFLVSEEGADPVMQDVLGLKSSQLEGVVDPDGDLKLARTVDPDHIKRLAESYLHKRGVTAVG